MNLMGAGIFALAGSKNNNGGQWPPYELSEPDGFGRHSYAYIAFARQTTLGGLPPEAEGIGWRE